MLLVKIIRKRHVVTHHVPLQQGSQIETPGLLAPQTTSSTSSSSSRPPLKVHEFPRQLGCRPTRPGTQLQKFITGLSTASPGSGCVAAAFIRWGGGVVGSREPSVIRAAGRWQKQVMQKQRKEKGRSSRSLPPYKTPPPHPGYLLTPEWVTAWAYEWSEWAFLRPTGGPLNVINQAFHGS